MFASLLLTLQHQLSTLPETPAQLNISVASAQHGASHSLPHRYTPSKPHTHRTYQATPNTCTLLTALSPADDLITGSPTGSGEDATVLTAKLEPTAASSTQRRRTRMMTRSAAAAAAASTAGETQAAEGKALFSRSKSAFSKVGSLRIGGSTMESSGKENEGL